MITWSIYDNPYNSKDAIAEFETGLKSGGDGSADYTDSR